MGPAYVWNVCSAGVSIGGFLFGDPTDHPTTGDRDGNDTSTICVHRKLTRGQAQPRSRRPRMSSSVKAPARVPSSSRTLSKRADLRALSSMTFSSIVPVET